jgi:hypothetical protein
LLLYRVYVVNHELLNLFRKQEIQVYEYVHHIVDVLVMIIHHQMLAEKIKILRRKNFLNNFTRRRINSSGRKIFVDVLEKTFDADDDVIT